MTITQPPAARRRRAFHWVMLAATLCCPAHAQTGAVHPPETDKTDLAAFGKAFMVARAYFIDPIPARTLISRAVHGLATTPAAVSQDQKRIIAAASDQLAATGAEDAAPLLRIFGNTLDALRAAAGGPAMDVMLRAALAGMLDGLDAQTRFTPPASPAGAGTEAGAGLKLTDSPKGPLVIEAYSQSPAAKAGVQHGDNVVSIDRRPTKGLKLAEIMTLLRGPAGSSTTLVIERDGVSAPITVELTRAVIRVPLISARRIGSVAYLRVEAFEPGVAQGLLRAFTALQSQNATPLIGVVLDLRNNVGGRLTEAVAAADEFLPPSTLIGTITGRAPGENQRFLATAGDMTGGLPLVVLVNEVTAAGSEIVAAALQKGRGAIVMGSHTAGSGLVATVIPLPPLGTMQVTTQQIVLASGEKLQQPGVLPQLALIARQTAGSGPPPLEALSSDPMIVRLRRGLPQTPQAGEAFDAPDAPTPDFEIRQACAALAMPPPGPSLHP